MRPGPILTPDRLRPHFSSSRMGPQAAEAMELTVRIRQGFADVLVFLLSVQLVSQLLHVVDRWLQPLHALLQLAATAFALVCSCYFTENDLVRARLLCSYPPRRLIPLGLHFLGLLGGLVMVQVGR